MDSFFEIFGMYRYTRTEASNQMDIKEAEAALRSRPIDDMVTPYSSSACRVLANEYLRLTDTTPLTVELIEKELGKPDRFGQWKVGDTYIGWNTMFKCANVYGFTFTTLGHLRQIVAMLRGGA